MPLPWPGVTGQHTPLLPGHLHHPYQADGMRNEDCGFKCSTLQASQLACSLPLPNPLFTLLFFIPAIIVRVPELSAPFVTYNRF